MSDALVIDSCSPGTLVLAGELDINAGPQLREALERRPERPLVLDLAGVVFVDSSGLRCLLDAARTGVRCVNVSPVVMRLLELAGVTDILTGDHS